MTIPLLLALELLGGVAGCFAQPARQGLLPGVVPRADLPASVAVNSFVFNLARFIGPAPAGPVILVWGVAPAFACNALAILTSAFGVGALVSGLPLAARGLLAGTTRIAILAIAAQAAATAAFVPTGVFALGVLSAAAIGAMASLHGIAVQMLVHSASEPAMRGRVLAVWGLITRAGPAAGALALGAAGEAFGMAWPVHAAVLLALGVVAWGLTVAGRAAASLERTD